MTYHFNIGIKKAPHQKAQLSSVSPQSCNKARIVVVYNVWEEMKRSMLLLGALTLRLMSRLSHSYWTSSFRRIQDTRLLVAQCCLMHMRLNKAKLPTCGAETRLYSSKVYCQICAKNLKKKKKILKRDNAEKILGVLFNYWIYGEVLSFSELMSGVSPQNWVLVWLCHASYKLIGLGPGPPLYMSMTGLFNSSCSNSNP